jgi:hypothetical protein
VTGNGGASYHAGRADSHRRAAPLFLDRAGESSASVSNPRTKTIEPEAAPRPVSLTSDDLGALVDILRAVVPATWPSAADVAAAVQRVRDTMVESVKFTRDKRGARVTERRRRKHKLSTRQARAVVQPLDVSIGAAMFVDEVNRRQPALLDGRDARAVGADVERRWLEVHRQHPGEDEDDLSRRLLSAGLAAIGVADPTHGVLRKVRASKARAARDAAGRTFDAWKLDRCEMGEGKLSLRDAIADYNRPGAPALTTKRLSALLSAVPGVRRITEGREKVVTFTGVRLKPDVRAVWNDAVRARAG